MTDVSYMPGCTLKTTAGNFDAATVRFMKLFDINLVELEEWFCCGTTYSLSSDNLMYHLAPVRTLIKAKETGRTDLLVPCAMCYNTLKRAQLLLLSDEEKRDKINEFMYKEKTSFSGDEVRVVHLLNMLEELGFAAVAEKLVKRPETLKVALYYGCMLLRPAEISVDQSPEYPSLFEQLFAECGCEPVYFPFRTECCGSYQTLNEKELVTSRTRQIVGSAAKNGAELIITSCPLCCYNLDSYQEKVLETDPAFTTIPVMYISQVLSLMAGLDDIDDYSLHAVDPCLLLREKGLLS